MPDVTGAIDSPALARTRSRTPLGAPGLNHGHAKWAVIAGIFILAALLVVGTWQAGMQGSNVGALIGKPAPDFTLATFDGTAVRLSDFRGRPVVINFWASWCPPCRSEAPALGKVARAEHDANRAVFLGIDVRDQEASARRFLADFAVPYANGPDPGSVEAAYHAIGLPFTVFVAADGTVARTWIGPLDEQRLTSIIDEIA